MKKIVSIITPVRNERAYIATCINSLLAQTVNNKILEIIIIDGMSDDGTRDIIQSYVKKFHHIQLLDNPRKYVPFALNIGLRHASGDIIIRVDGHARIAPDYVQKCLEYLAKTGADCVGGKIDSINKTLKGKAIALAMSSVFGVGNSRFRTSQKERYVDTLAFGAYRKEIFKKIGLFDEEFIRNQDDEFNYRLRKFGGKIFLTPNIKSWYYSRSNYKKLWRQYFGYGFWKIRVMQKHLNMMQLRQFIPSLFILVLIVTGIFSLVWSFSFWIFLFVFLLYLFSSCIISLLLAFKHEIILFPKILIAFPVLHFSYGIGFFWGIIRLFPKWFKK